MVAIDGHGHGLHGARRARPRAGRIVPAVLGVCLPAYGAAKIDALPLSEAATAISAKGWPVAEAQVTAASLDEVSIQAPGGAEIGLRLSVSYRFDVNGRAVAGTAASLADEGAADDRRLIALFRKAEFARITGRALPVSYDPDEPSRAYLQAQIPWGRMLPGLAYGVAAFLAAGWCFARAFARQDGREPRA